ncbi:polyubiquitin, partial [Serendipita vermifera]
QQRLLHGGMELTEERPLSDYGIKGKTTILLGDSKPEFQIFVRNLNGRTMTISVKADETVESLRRKVEDKTDIPAETQRLLYAGKQLVPGRVLSDYNIQKMSTVELGQRVSLL